MTENLKEKLTSTSSLIFGGAIVIALTVIGQIASNIAFAQQAIPCLFFLGQPKMPVALQNKIKDNNIA